MIEMDDQGKRKGTPLAQGEDQSFYEVDACIVEESQDTAMNTVPQGRQCAKSAGGVVIGKKCVAQEPQV